MVIASSISGLPIYAPSAAFAPTNSAEVSAIASAYQVVSSTATQLYAGTAYVTSVNDAPLSASRAGNAANASLASSAWYDGTGRLISSLPDSAAVSAIASAYAESAASSKQDTLTFGYDAEDKISSIGGSALAGEDGTTYVSPSGTVWISGSSIEATDSAYLPSREDTTFVYSSDRFTGVYTGSNVYTATGANLIYASGLFLSGTLSALDSNNVLAAVSSYSGENDVRFSASAEQGPLKLQSDFFWNMHYISAYTAYTKSASVVPLAHASALPTYQYNTASAISGINGSALAAGSTYSAGEGIDITDDVISVEAPVDIVAGPGIVIDNPDGNTLRVSTEADAETVLYDAGDSPSQTGPWQISEARTNFEWLDIVFGNDTTGSMKQVTRFAADSEYMKLHLPRYDEEPSYKWSTMTLSWNNTTASIKTNSVGRFTIASNGSVSVSTAAAQAPYLFQIIGVHRINGGN